MSEESTPGSSTAPIVKVSVRASRYSKEFTVTMISLVTTALGVVVALAWNTALTAFFNRYVRTEGRRVVALFTYAALITAIGVFVVFFLGKLATRIDAEPVEFKAPAKKD